MKKIALFSALTLAVVAIPVPAAAAAATVVPVLTAPCAGGLLVPGSAHADKGGDGKVRGFTTFEYGPGCGDAITFFEGSGSSWASGQTALHGKVIDVAADSTGTYLLYLNTAPPQRGSGPPPDAELAVTKRLHDGTFTHPHWLADVGSLAPSWAGRGSIIASGGRWFAVWPQTSSVPGRYVLHQADAMWDGGDPGEFAHPAPTTPVAADTNPALAMGADGQPRLFWQRSVAGGRKDLLLAQGAYGAWQPATRVAGAVAINSSYPAMDVVATGTRIFTTWTTTFDGDVGGSGDGRVMVGSSADNGVTFTLSPPPVMPDHHAGNSAILRASSSSLLAAFSTTDGGEPKRPNLGVKLGSRPWTVDEAGPSVPASIDSVGAAALIHHGQGRTTTLIHSGDRLYAATR
ncbi:hypothetical protein QLQ12_43410 [Actinoplanes sp. NEAU-A12]|uniref:Uncharacterized protein n=1 Tax=Actinoplanes sandaracinus TaxID=3045177 RepID=A0ABT6X0D9_9ACTN|nr:hypothetical protein [Actinoplanes sandaracinus]MDI6105453.1 hypothetical protein [Actinoplanes sandaracinus]